MHLFFKGVPHPPAIKSLSLKGNSLRSSWDNVRIPTVDVTLYWSLSFFTPSQLSNITINPFDTSTYNYTLEGERSCDPFRQCFRAEIMWEIAPGAVIIVAYLIYLKVKILNSS